MKALSLWQPWASAIALGFKQYETRHWSTAYRGTLVIHAAKRMTGAEREFIGTLRASGVPMPNELPLMAIVAVATLADVLPTERVVATIDARERMLGNFEPARFAWKLHGIWLPAAPIIYRGAQGLFDVPRSVLAQTEWSQAA